MIELLGLELVFLEIAETAWVALSIRLSGYQPQYFPRLHYFARMLDSDIFTVGDYLQYVRRHAYILPDGSKRSGSSHQAHTLTKSAQGVREIGVPVLHQGLQRLRDTRIDYSTSWNEKHLNSIREDYRRAPYFDEVFPEVRAILLAQHASLAELSGTTILWGLFRLFEIPHKPARESLDELHLALRDQPFRLTKMLFLCEEIVPPPDKANGRDANEWLIDQCKTLGADEYHYGGKAAGAYMDPRKFERSGITLHEQKWECRPYPQLHGSFVSNLSILDLLMNVSPAEARGILHTKSAQA